MFLTIFGLCIKSMISSLLAIILVHLFVGWLIPPIGFVYLTVAYMCRYSLSSFHQVENNEDETEDEEEKK